MRSCFKREAQDGWPFPLQMVSSQIHPLKYLYGIYWDNSPYRGPGKSPTLSPQPFNCPANRL